MGTARAGATARKYSMASEIFIHGAAAGAANTSTGSSGTNNRVTGMHQPGAMVALVDQIGNVVYHWDLRVDYRVPAAEGPDGQRPHRQLVADLHRMARLAELRGSLCVGVQRGTRVGIEQGGQARDVDVVRVLMGNHDRGQPGDSLETMCESAGIKEQAGLPELGQ